jgi:hypothetical protein
MKPIFIMSSERSGTNLVREMLNAHPNISAPAAVQLPRQLSKNRYYYGDLSVDGNMKRMIANALVINKTHPDELKMNHSVDEIFDLLPERSVWGVISTLYSLNAKEQGKTAWASKDNYLFNYVFAIKKSLPDARFVYLFRDGRDYACSMRKVSPQNVHMYNIAKQWREEQQACLQAYYDFKQEGCVHLLRYEDLLVHSEATLRKLCEFLAEPFNEAMLNFHEGGSAKKLAAQSPYWENLSKPLITTNFAKFQKELTMREISLFESVAGRELTLLGYPRISGVVVREPSQLQRFRYKLENRYLLYRKNLEKREPWREPRETALKGISQDLFSFSSSDAIIDPLEYK